MTPTAHLNWVLGSQGGDMDYILLLLQILCLFGGVVLIYFAAFSYEDEESKVQDKLEGWWVSLNDIEGGLGRKLTGFVKKSNELVDNFLSKLLGESIFSIQFVAISTTLSFAVIIPLLSVTLIQTNFYVAMLISLFMIIRSLMPLWGKSYPIVIPGVLVALIVISPLVLQKENNDPIVNWLVVLWAALSLTSDVAITSMARKLIRKLKDKWGGFLIFILPVFVLICVIIISYFSIFVLGPFSWVYLSVMNMPSIIFSLLLIAFPFMLLVGRVSFTFIGRLFYQVQRHRLILNKKVLWTLAAFQLSFVPFAKPIIAAISSIKF